MYIMNGFDGLNGRALPNNALERVVTSLEVGAAGACEEFAPAALGSALPRAAQRGR